MLSSLPVLEWNDSRILSVGVKMPPAKFNQTTAKLNYKDFFIYFFFWDENIKNIIHAYVCEM